MSPEPLPAPVPARSAALPGAAPQHLLLSGLYLALGAVSITNVGTVALATSALLAVLGPGYGEYREARDETLTSRQPN